LQFKKKYILPLFNFAIHDIFMNEIVRHYQWRSYRWRNDALACTNKSGKKKILLHFV